MTRSSTISSSSATSASDRRDVTRRRGAGQLQAANGDAEIRRGAVGRHLQRQSDAAQMRLAGRRRRGFEGNIAGEVDDTARLAEQNRIGDAMAGTGCLEQRQVQARRGLWRLRGELYAESNADVIGGLVVNDCVERYRRIAALEQR